MAAPSDPGELLALGEQVLADFFLDFALCQVDSAIQFGEYFTIGLPGCFGALHAPLEEDRVAAFCYLKVMWNVLQGLEEISLKDDFYVDVICKMMWPQSVWVREILIGAAENNFTSLPTVALRECVDTSRAFRSTKIIEDAGNRLRSVERVHSANKLGRIARWFQLVHSPLLAESDRKQVQTTPTDRAQALACISKNIFMCEKGKFSLGEDAMQDFMDRKGRWHSPAPDMLYECIMLTTAARLAGERPEVLKTAWLARLCKRGTILVQKNIEGNFVKPGLVVHTSDWGVIVLPMVPKRVNTVKLWNFNDDPDSPIYEQILVTDLSWFVGYIQALPPAVGNERFVGGERPEGILLVDSAVGLDTLIKAAAREAFSELTVARMKDLAAFQEMDFGGRRRPTTAYEWARLLVSKALDVEYGNNEVLNPILEKRGMKTPQRFSTSLGSADTELTTGVLNEEDVGDLRHTVAEIKAKELQEKGKKKEAAKAKPKAAAKKAAKAAAGLAPARPRILSLLAGDEVDVVWARQFLPGPVVGCSLGKDSTFHYRFIGQYPNEFPPRMSTKAWNASISEWKACIYCLRWIWTCHTLATGEPCPFDFDAWSE